MALTKVSGEVITRPLVLTGNASVSGIMTVGTGSTTTTIDGSQDFPTIRPTLDLNFAATKTLDRRITFIRDSIGTYTDELGIIRTAPNNVPRFDHDPETGESLGLLIEESRTNYCTSSVDLSSSLWQGTGSYGIDNAITNPDGSVGAYYHTGLELYHSMDLSGASTNVITVSTWVKERSGQSGNLDIQIYQQITGSIINLSIFGFNPATATLDTSGANFSDGKVVEYPNGWYRISVKVTAPSGNFSSSTRIDFQNNEHYVWGTQVEVGSFPTSYIPTSGSAVTRSADFAKITGTNFTDFYNYTESSISLEYSIKGFGTTTGFNRLFQIDDTTNDNRYGVLLNGTNQTLYEFFFIQGTNNVDYNASTITYNDFYRLSVGFKQNDYYRYTLNASGNADSNTDDSIDIDNFSPTQLVFYESSTNIRQLNGHMRSFTYYNKRLTNSQLQSLTRQ